MSIINIFAPIEGYDGYYISQNGEVASIKSGKWKLMKLQKNIDGYYVVGLHNNNKCKIVRVNRLVAIAFIPNPKKLPYVDHIDKNINNNNISNLRWVSPFQNNLNLKNVGKISIRKTRYKKKYRAQIPIYDEKTHIRGESCKTYEKHFYKLEEAEAWLEEKRKEREIIHSDPNIYL